MDTPRNRISWSLARLRTDCRGATAIEYGLIASLIAVAAITAMNGMSTQLKNTFNTTANAMSSARGTAS